jgi:hypothetical protein
MARRRSPEPFALSPLQGGRRASRRRRTSAPAALALVVLAAVALGVIVFGL